MQENAFIKTFEIGPEKTGRLNNLKFAAKDLIDIAGYKTGGGNPTWEKTHPPATAHAICIEQLLQEGATCVGKTVSDELAFGLLGENYFYGTPLNPKAPDRVPGGSSSGSASAVAANLVDFALGTDTGGSVRVPASNCGIYGFRPSHGRISLSGVIPLAPSFDTVGVLAREHKILSDVVHTLLESSPPSQSSSMDILLLEDIFKICDDDVTRSLSLPPHLQRTSLKEIFEEPLTVEELFSIYCTLQWSEIWNTFGAWIEKTNPEFGPTTKDNFALAKNAPRDHIGETLEKRALIKKKLSAFLGQNRCLCFPTTPALAPKRGMKHKSRTENTYFSRLIGMTSLAGLGSLPQISLPYSSSGSIPVGLSLISAKDSDEKLLEVAKLFLKPLN